MPPGGAGVRAEQLATLERLAHEALTSDEIGRLLDELAPHEEALEYDSDEASLIRLVRRDWEKARRVPAELRAEMTRAASLAMPVWVKARQESDFSQFLPALRTNFELRRRYVECFDDYDEPYDVLLDDFEPGMKTAEVRAVFDRLKEEQVPLVAAARAGRRAAGARRARSRSSSQKEFELKVIERFGFDPSEWRLDTAVHPFASSIAIGDIRLTTRYFDDNLDGLFGTMHETGHGLYEHGVSRDLERTPLARGASLGLHESQSRMWENMVGRSLPFWRHFYPAAAGDVPATRSRTRRSTTGTASVNWVAPSLIRVEADEATYNLHIILRFELEQELLADSIDLEELPEIWNQRMQDYLGVEPPNDALGVLQDMHWAVGAIGYFSTYALGNVISGQLWEKVTAEIPDLHDQFEQGEFGALADWLQREPLAPRPQVHAARADRADHGRRARPGAVPALPARQVPARRLDSAAAQTTRERRRHGDSRRDQRLRPDRAELLPRAARARRRTSRSSLRTTSATQATMAHLLKYDSNLGPLQGDVELGDGVIRAGGEELKLLSERDPGAIPWGDLGVDVVLESTGFFTKRDGAQKHLDAGAKKVVISAPATDPDVTLVLGVNDDDLRQGRAPHRLERLLHDELRRADGEGAARRVHDRAGLHDDDPRVHERPAHPRPAARGPAPRPRGRDQPDPDLDRRRPRDRARPAGAQGQGRRHVDARAGADRLGHRPRRPRRPRDDASTR